MSTRYEKYNEITFEKYCRTSITNAVLKGRIEKSKRASREISIDDLPDAMLCSFSIDSVTLEDTNFEIRVFEIAGTKIAVHDAALGYSISFLPKKIRDIVLMSYYLGLSDQEIADRLGTIKSTVQHRRIAGLRDLKRHMVAWHEQHTD